MPCDHGGITIRPDGIHELAACVYRDMEIHTKVDLTISRCIRCEELTFSWVRTPETEDIILEGDDD